MTFAISGELLTIRHLKNKTFWLLDVDASFGLLTKALLKGYVIRLTEHTVNTVWLAPDNSRAAWNEELVVEKELARLRGPHAHFKFIHSADIFWALIVGFGNALYWGPIPYLNEQIILTQCTKCSYQVSPWESGDTESLLGVENLMMTLLHCSLRRKCSVGTYLFRILHVCREFCILSARVVFFPSFFLLPLLTFSLNQTQAKSAISRGSWCYNVGMLNV